MIAAASNAELVDLFCTLLLLGAVLCLILGVIGLVSAFRLGIQPGAAIVLGIVLFVLAVVLC